MKTNGNDIITMQFEAGTGRKFDSVNFLHGTGNNGISVYAEIEVPDGASDDYGYLTMKEEIMDQLPECTFAFPYDGQESYLEADAEAVAEVYTEIDK